MTMRGIKSLALLLGGSFGAIVSVQIGMALLIGSSLVSAVVAETPLPEAIELVEVSLPFWCSR